MGARENSAQRECWLEAGRQGCKVFRMNSGKAWAGKAARQDDGSVVIAFAQPANLGFGYPDNKPVSGPGYLIGWTPQVITPETVGQTVPVSTRFQAKPVKAGPVSGNHKTFRDHVSSDDGIPGDGSPPTGE